MANEKDEIDVIDYLCKYQIPTLSFVLEDEEIQVNSTDIISLTKFDDYDSNIRSMLKLIIRIDRRKKLWLIKNKRKVICKIELVMIGLDSADSSSNENENIILDQEDIFNLEFGVFFNDDEEAYDNEMSNVSTVLDERGNDNINEDIATENYGEFENYLDIYLFNLELLNPSNTMVNEVYTKDTLQQIVAHLLTKTQHKKVIMSPFENDEVYNELLVPAHPIYEALAYLENYYGFYKTGAMIYYDIDTLYILNTNGEMSAKQEDEWIETTILINNHAYASSENGMLRRTNEKINYIQIEEKDFHVNKPSIINNNSMGSDLTMVTINGTDLQEIKADQSYTDKRNKRVMYMKQGDNKYLGSILETRMEENEIVVEIAAMNLDIRAFTPNKVFTLIFDDENKQEKYGKWKYRLVRAFHKITLDGIRWAKSVHQFALKKTQTDHEVEESHDDVE